MFDKLERAILSGRPELAKSLQPGLSHERVREILNRARVEGNVYAVVALYSWRNGSHTATPWETFFPKAIYHFLPLEDAVQHWASVQKAIGTLVELGTPVAMPKEEGRYLPTFFDGASGSLAIDLKPGMNNRVMAVEFESEEPFREVCSSFDEFIIEATRAIEKDELPIFLDLQAY